MMRRRQLDEIYGKSSRRAGLVGVRQAIADQVGDVNAYIALERDRSGRGPDILAVAERLLAAGRPLEALDWVRRPARPGLRAMSRQDVADGAPGTDLRDRERARLKVRILTALGQS